jgi:hypothetical protein
LGSTWPTVPTITLGEALSRRAIAWVTTCGAGEAGGDRNDRVAVAEAEETPPGEWAKWRRAVWLLSAEAATHLLDGGLRDLVKGRVASLHR